jgi:hypothetical protein
LRPGFLIRPRSCRWHCKMLPRSPRPVDHDRGDGSRQARRPDAPLNELFSGHRPREVRSPRLAMPAPAR